MLDVVLYRIDSAGRIDLRERPFKSLQDLAAFFASDGGGDWEWAEIDGCCRCTARRFSARELRAIAGRAGEGLPPVGM